MKPTYQELLDIRNRIIEGDLERALSQLRFFELTDETRYWVRKEMEGYTEGDDLPKYRQNIPLLRSDPNGILGPDYPKTSNVDSPLSFILDRRDDGMVYSSGPLYKVYVTVPEVHKVAAAVEGIVTDFIAAALEGYNGKNESKVSTNWDSAKSHLHQLVIGVVSSLAAGQIQ